MVRQRGTPASSPQVRNSLQEDATYGKSAPSPDRRLAATDNPSLALRVTLTAGEGQIAPRDHAAAAAISWTAEEASPR